MLKIKARILDPPTLLYGAGSIVRLNNKDGGWNMTGKQFYRAANLPIWTSLEIVWSATPNARGTLNNIEMALKKELVNCGVSPKLYYTNKAPILILNKRDPIEKQTGYIRERLVQFRKEEIKMLYLVIPKKDKELYAAVKYLADVELGIYTVLSSRETLDNQRRLEQYFANVALKFNLKRGGINQQLSPPGSKAALALFKNAKTMVVGVDVTHPSPGSLEKSPSIAAVVASIGTDFGQWPGKVFLHSSRQEVLNDLEEVMMGRLALWQDKNKSYPERIIVYRDGVSEGEYRNVSDTEVAAIRNAMRRINKPQAPISFIIVGKRHHTRFYPIDPAFKDQSTNPEDASKSGNPRHGLVVDRGITNTRQWDFFLQSHHAIKGTARPAHIVVLLDENDLGADGLEKLVCGSHLLEH